ncbi:MAG: hypothetical protein ACD_62C00184G0001 [uncultured bacterium]|nr:MAG: hypothetical protein ACD_62C00184G0001 [uncultured bacterium]
MQDEITSTFSAEDATEIRESVSIFSSQDELVVSLGDTEYTVSFTDLSLTVSYDTEDGYTETYAGTVTIDDENYELSELLNESTE